MVSSGTDVVLAATTPRLYPVRKCAGNRPQGKTHKSATQEKPHQWCHGRLSVCVCSSNGMTMSLKVLRKQCPADTAIPSVAMAPTCTQTSTLHPAFRAAEIFQPPSKKGSRQCTAHVWPFPQPLPPAPPPPPTLATRLYLCGSPTHTHNLGTHLPKTQPKCVIPEVPSGKPTPPPYQFTPPAPPKKKAPNISANPAQFVFHPPLHGSQ